MSLSIMMRDLTELRPTETTLQSSLFGLLSFHARHLKLEFEAFFNILSKGQSQRLCRWGILLSLPIHSQHRS